MGVALEEGEGGGHVALALACCRVLGECRNDPCLAYQNHGLDQILLFPLVTPKKNKIIQKNF